MRHAVLVIVTAVGCAHHQPAAAPPPADTLRDTTAHTARTLEVAPGVALEVLDYGGTGEPVLLLAGLGNTAHIWDDFAPALIDRHHVVAITRRGFGSSSGPESGYDVATRAADDLAVLDKLGIQRAMIVGHSLAGDELTEIAATHGERVSGLIYIDAAQDHVKAGELLGKLPPGLAQPPPAEALTSVKAFAAFSDHLLGFTFPPGEHLATLEVGPKGELNGMKGLPDAGSRYLQGTTHPDYTRVHSRALVLLAWPVVESIPGFATADDTTKQALRAVFPEVTAMTQAAYDDVKAHLAGAKLVEYPQGNHYLFITERAKVLAEIRAFLD